MGIITLVTDTGNANSTRLRLVLFPASPVPVTRAINPHIALSTVLLTIHIGGGCTVNTIHALDRYYIVHTYMYIHGVYMYVPICMLIMKSTKVQTLGAVALHATYNRLHR